MKTTAMLLALGAAMTLAACDKPAVPVQPRAEAAQPADSNIALRAADDPALLKAREEARRSLPHFWSQLGQPGVSNAALKVSLDTSDGSLEHIWANDVVRQGDRIQATIANEPEDIPGVANGQRITVDPGRIYDWAYDRDGRSYGHFSTRVIMSTMPPAETAEMRGMFHPTPLPPGAR